MLDFPELLPLARSVKGRTSIVCSSTIDLKPETDSDMIAGGIFGTSPEAPFDLGILRRPFIEWITESQGPLSQEFGRPESRSRPFRFLGLTTNVRRDRMTGAIIGSRGRER